MGAIVTSNAPTPVSVMAHGLHKEHITVRVLRLRTA